MIFQSPGTIIKVETLADHTLKLSVVTPELSPESYAALFTLKGSEGWFAFKETRLEENEIGHDGTGTQNGTENPAQGNFEPHSPIQGKSVSQRLRSVMFVYHKQQGMSLPFETWYTAQIEAFIEHYKSKLA